MWLFDGELQKKKKKLLVFNTDRRGRDGEHGYDSVWVEHGSMTWAKCSFHSRGLLACNHIELLCNYVCVCRWRKQWATNGAHAHTRSGSLALFEGGDAQWPNSADTCHRLIKDDDARQPPHPPPPGGWGGPQEKVMNKFTTLMYWPYNCKWRSNGNWCYSH